MLIFFTFSGITSTAYMMVLNFRKPTRPSLLIKRAALGNLKASFHCTHWHRFFPLKKAPPLISVFFNGLYTPFGSPVSGGQKPQARRRKPPSGARNRYALRSADQSGLRHIVRDGTALIRCFLCLILRHILYESEESKDKLNMLLSSH